MALAALTQISKLKINTGWAKKTDHFWELITFSSNELEDVLNVSFCSKNSLKKLVTDHKLIFNAAVKYSLQMQQRSLKALWFLLLFQN